MCRPSNRHAHRFAHPFASHIVRDLAMTKRWSFACVCAFALVLTTGCTLVRPKAQASAVTIGSSKGDTTAVVITLELLNPGEDEIELIEYDYVLRLADGAAYGGKWAALRALPPGERVTATIPAVVPTASLHGGATSWTVTGTLGYRDPESVVRILYEAGILKTATSVDGRGDSIRPAPTTPSETPPIATTPAKGA